MTLSHILLWRKAAIHPKRQPKHFVNVRRAHVPRAATLERTLWHISRKGVHLEGTSSLEKVKSSILGSAPFELDYYYYELVIRWLSWAPHSLRRSTITTRHICLETPHLKEYFSLSSGLHAHFKGAPSWRGWHMAKGATSWHMTWSKGWEKKSAPLLKALKHISWRKNNH